MLERESPASSADSAPVILFDGMCHLCSASVTWIIARDPDAVFRFAALQSDCAARLLAHHGRTVDRAAAPDSVVVIDADGVFVDSEAALRIVRRLRRPWPLLYALRFVPRAIRDGAYRLIARRRYRWFGRREACWTPTTDPERRFLDDCA